MRQGFRSVTLAREERVVAEVKRLSVAGLEGTVLLRRVVEAVRPAVPFDAYCASTIDPASKLMTHGIADGLGDDDGHDRELSNVFLEQVYFEEDLDQICAMLRDGRRVTLLSEATGGRLDRSVRYRDLLRPLGLRHELGAVFVDRGLWGGMDLMRTADRPNFSQREVDLVRVLTPHVGAGLKAATLSARASGEPAGDDVPGVLTLDRQGRVAATTPSAERHLADLADDDLGWRPLRGLPVAVRMVAGALERTLNPRSDQDVHLVPRLRVRGRSGRWLTLHALLTEPVAERASEQMIVIAPAQPEEIAWLNVAAYGLSPREEEVVKLVARGYSTKQLSDTLFISEHTVQRHLSNIFEKVGVRGRRALMKRLFFENLLPSLSAS